MTPHKLHVVLSVAFFFCIIGAAIAVRPTIKGPEYDAHHRVDHEQHPEPSIDIGVRPPIGRPDMAVPDPAVGMEDISSMEGRTHPAPKFDPLRRLLRGA